MQNLPSGTAVLLPGGRSYFLVLPDDLLSQGGIEVGTVCQFQVEHRQDRSYLIFKAVTRKTSFPGVARVHEGDMGPCLPVDRYLLTDLGLPLAEFEVHDQFVLETTVDEPVIGLSPVDFATFAVSDGELLDADEGQARREQYHQQTDSSVPETSRNDVGDQGTEQDVATVDTPSLADGETIRGDNIELAAHGAGVSPDSLREALDALAMDVDDPPVAGADRLFATDDGPIDALPSDAFEMLITEAVPDAGEDLRSAIRSAHYLEAESRLAETGADVDISPGSLRSLSPFSQ